MPQLFKRLRRRTGATHTPAPITEGDGVDLGAYPGLDDLLNKGEIAEAIRLVAQTDTTISTVELARIDLQLRNEAFRRLRGQYPPAAQWPPAVSEHAPDELPDIPADQMTTQAVIDGVRVHGAIIIRGLFSEAVCERLRNMIDESFTAREQGGHPAYFHQVRDVHGNTISPEYRDLAYFNGGAVPAPDVPAAAVFALQQFAELGVLDLARQYLGEQPALSLEKWTLRRVPPTTGTSWHQDGAFLGTELHALNFWLALSDCGRTSSGLDLVGKRFDHIVATGTSGAHFHWDVAPDIVEQERGDAPILDPEFSAGDAVFFDQFLLHRTGVKPNMTQDRYALESWFFTPSSFPADYDGLLV